MARQKLGQHFLSSPKILERIASAACGEGISTVVEVGPGRGALTEYLLTRADRVIAIEIDREMIAALQVRFGDSPKLTLVRADAAEAAFESWQPDVICGNLPYYAATPIIHRLVRASIRGVVLIQKEVAERLTAKPGSREYGYLTCEVALFADARVLFQVKPGAFRPPPQVDSTLISLEPHRRIDELQVPEKDFLAFLSASFRQKRKTLRNNLLGRYPAQLLADLPEAQLRAEQCSLESFASIYRRLTGGMSSVSN